jgi:acyl carrier protein
MLYDEIVAMLAKQLKIKDVSTIRPDSKIKEELGADSIDVLQVLLTLEEERGITIPDEELATFKVVQDVVDYLEKQLKND